MIENNNKLKTGIPSLDNLLSNGCKPNEFVCLTAVCNEPKTNLRVLKDWCKISGINFKIPHIVLPAKDINIINKKDY